MSRSLNKAMIIGNLGADPEVKVIPSGSRVASFRIATSRRWNDRSGQQQEKTEWHRIVAWDRLAEIVERYLKKGDRVYVEGSMETRQWEDQQSGQTRYMTEIRAREMIMLGGREAGSGGSESYSAPPAQAPIESGATPDFSSDALAGEDDLPF
jgi:single-strand DNA-binding protein